MARIFNFITTGLGGGVQVDGGDIEYPVNKSGVVKSNGVNVSFRVGDIYEQIIVGTDTVNIDGVPWADTADNLAKKLQGILNVLGNVIGV